MLYIKIFCCMRLCTPLIHLYNKKKHDYLYCTFYSLHSKFILNPQYVQTVKRMFFKIFNIYIYLNNTQRLHITNQHCYSEESVRKQIIFLGLVLDSLQLPNESSALNSDFLLNGLTAIVAALLMELSCGGLRQAVCDITHVCS